VLLPPALLPASACASNAASTPDAAGAGLSALVSTSRSASGGRAAQLWRLSVDSACGARVAEAAEGSGRQWRRRQQQCLTDCWSTHDYRLRSIATIGAPTKRLHDLPAAWTRCRRSTHEQPGLTIMSTEAIGALGCVANTIWMLPRQLLTSALCPPRGRPVEFTSARRWPGGKRWQEQAKS